jgi:transposase
MAWRGLTQQQWAAIHVHLAAPKGAPRGGRPRIPDRRCFEGILWILWTGAQWSELPRRYGSPSTCWRRLKHWEETEVLLTLWRAFLAQLNDQEKIRWDECFTAAASCLRKRGTQGRHDETRQGYEVDGSGRWRGYSAGSIPGGGVPGGSPPPRTDARHGRGRPAGQTGPAPQATRSRDRGSGL